MKIETVKVAVFDDRTMFVNAADLEHYVVQLLRQGEVIKAIKYVRENTGVSLKHAKEYVDHLKYELSR